MENFSPRKKPAEPVKRRCHRCRGTGRAPCPICGGAGQVPGGTDRQGNPQFVRCSGCFGARAMRCSQCGGDGYL
ncbi:MAG: hypothetical protein NXH83_15435 [Rhodobacteraceae bacterium]|nr:hypothetical protein [Paracoccaceae bacterium]